MPKAVLKSGLKIHYQAVGQGPDLVMIHGLTGNLAVWHLKIIPMLWDRFRILTYDLRGHGYSDMPPSGYTPDQMAEDLLQLLDALGMESPMLVGHSFGGDIALNFAYRYPARVKAVVAIEATLPAMIPERSREDWPGWDYWTEALERSGHPVPPERRCDMDYLIRASVTLPKRWGPLAGLPRNPKPFLTLLDTTTIARDALRVGALTLDRVPSIATPVTIIYGEGSAFSDTYDFLRKHLPNVRAVLLPRNDLGHFGPLQHPEIVGKEILSGLEAAEPAAAISGMDPE